jgi:hypothetical protein
MPPVPLLVAALVAGCGAQRIVFRPTAKQRAELAGPPLDLSVVVIDWSPKAAQGRSSSAYASKLTALLVGSGAFRSVVYDPTGAAAKSADLVAVSTGDYCNSAILPIATLVTLGVVPTVWDETNCDGASFRARDDRDTTVHVVARERRTGKAVMGWLALPLGLAPGWSHRVGAEQSAYRQAFRLAIIARKDELLRLAGK